VEHGRDRLAPGGLERIRKEQLAVEQLGEFGRQPTNA